MVLVCAAASAAEVKDECRDVRFGIVSWPAVTVKSELAKWMLEELGYTSEITTAATPIIYENLKQGRLEVFLAQWMPSQREVFRKYGQEGSIDIVSPNLRGGKYTLAVPSYVYEAGITSIDDLNANRDKFDGKIYGIDAGSGGNTTVQKMIEDDYAGLGAWELVQSSTSGMMVAVGNHIEHDDWIVFLGWSPHPMNIMYDMRYLAGASDYWGPNKGEVIVNTVVRSGYAWSCPNVGQFLDNYKWRPQEQSLVMHWVLNEDIDYLDAGKRIVRENPELLERWLQASGIYQTGGIRTADGEQHAYELIADAMDLD